jgi:uncharacterized membrane protein
MKKSKIDYLILFACSFCLLLPFFIRSYKVGNDTYFHLTNIIAMINSMHYFIPRTIIPNIAGIFGYGTRLFYPPFAHTLTAYISYIFHLNVLISMKIYYLIVLFLSGVTMYNWSLDTKKNRKIAIISGLIYMSFPYHLSEIYVRDAMAEAAIFIFLPMIFHSFYYLFKNNKKFMFYFIVGYVGGIISHLTMMIYFTILIIPYFLINYKKVLKKENFRCLLKSAFLILTIVSPIIINMIYNKILGNYMVFKSGVMAQGIQHSGLWIHFFNYFGLFNCNIFGYPFIDNKINFYFDIVALILFILSVKNRKFNGNDKYILCFMVISIGLSTVFFPWDKLPQGFRIIQFPWRMMCYVALGFSYLAPQCINDLKIDYKFIMIIIIGLSFFNMNPYRYKDVDLSKIDYEYGMGWQKEYLPVKVYENYEYFQNRGTGVVNGDVIFDDGNTLDFLVNTDSEVELPRIFYFGYSLEDIQGNKYSVYENNNGFVGANLKKGKYVLKYRGILLARVAEVSSLITIVMCLIKIKREKILK